MPEPANQKVGLSTLLTHFEESLGSAETKAAVTAVRGRYSSGEASYAVALHELQELVGRAALLDAAKAFNGGGATGARSDGESPASPRPAKVEAQPAAPNPTAQPEAVQGPPDSDEASDSPPIGRSTVHPAASDPASAPNATPWEGTFAFQKPAPPGNGDLKSPRSRTSPPGDDELAQPTAGTGIPMPADAAPMPAPQLPVLRIDVSDPLSEPKKKRGRDTVPPPFMPNGSLVLERPKRQVKGTTRFDPDAAATLPQMGMRPGLPPRSPEARGRRRDDDEAERPSSSMARTPPPQSPRVAAAGALMGASWAAASRLDTASPVRMSPRLAARIGQAVPACDALLLLGAAGAGLAHPSASGWSMMGSPAPRTPLSPRSQSSRPSSANAADPPALCLAAAAAAAAGQSSGATPSGRGARSGGRSTPGAGSGGEPKRRAASSTGKRGRVVHSAAFKLRLVKEALQRPPENRIKPTCRRYPSVEPCQLRKWINGRANLEKQAREARARDEYGDEDEEYE